MEKYSKFYREAYDYMERHIKLKNAAAAAEDINVVSRKYRNNRFLVDLLTVAFNELCRSYFTSEQVAL